MKCDTYPAAGKLNRKVYIQRLKRTKDAYGIIRETWTLAESSWAAIRTMTQAETSHDKGIVAAGRVLLTLRYRTDISIKDRIVYGSRVFFINSVVDVDEAHATLELTCSEVKDA